MIHLASVIFRKYQHRRLTKHLSSSIWKRISKILLLLVFFIGINTIGMLVFESMSFKDAIWLSFTTITTVGYGDISPASTEGRLITIVSMYLFGISLLPLMAAEVIEWRMGIAEKKRRGLWEWKTMQDHIQIINTPDQDTDRYLDRLVSQLQATPSLTGMPIQLLTRKYSEGLPNVLIKHKIIHRYGSAEDGQSLKSINLHLAKHIIILAPNSHDYRSDSVVFDTLSQVVDINPDANIVVEAVLDDNRQRFLKIGATSVLRPVRAYPEIVVRALSHPGTEQVLEDMFDIQGDSLCRIPCEFSEKPWKEIVLACLEKDIGTPMGYFKNGALVNHPTANEVCSGSALIVLVRESVSINGIDLSAIVNA